MVTKKNLLTVQINKICYSPEFNKYYCNKYKFAPSGMTLDIWEKDDGKFNSALVAKKYGYNSSTTGYSEYEDLSDYTINPYDFTDEQYEYVLKYFKDNYPDIYNNLN
jgi:hypothetical protein